MRLGVREICNVVFRAKAKQKLGSRTFFKDEPVLYFDTLKTSSLEGAATTVYAQGGRGNPRLIAWEGERTLTFTMEDALISPEGLSILTGAGLIASEDANNGEGMFVHMTDTIKVKDLDTIVITDDFACWNDTITSTDASVDADELKKYKNDGAQIFIMIMDGDNISTEPCIPAAVDYSIKDGKKVSTITCYNHKGHIQPDTIVLVDYYVRRAQDKSLQIEITADKFAGSYYIEADTLFRREGDNKDLPAQFVIPNGKVQSNFNFAMAATGDPSTFTFTVDAMPDYSKFDGTHKVLSILQVIDEDSDDIVEEREACTVQNFDTSAKGAVVEQISDTEFKISGTVTPNVKGNDLFDKGGTWNGGIVANVSIPEGAYIIRQTNEALKTWYPGAYLYYSGGEYIKVKDDYDLDAPDVYEFVITPDSTEIKIELIEGGTDNKNGTVDDGTPLKTYTIHADIKLA